MNANSLERAFFRFRYRHPPMECGINPLLDAILHLRTGKRNDSPCLLEGDALEIPVLNCKAICQALT